MKNQVNKKVSKMLITLFALVVMSVSCVVLAACNKECTHSKLTSQPDTATCTAGGFITYTCSDCGYTFMTATPAKNHTYGDAVKVAATCTTDGYTESTCKVCGFTDRKEVVAATGHTPKEIVTEATCSAAGSKVTVCETCETVLSVESLPALSHNFVKTSEVAATCGTFGYSVMTCSVCGEEKIVTGDKPTGMHSYVTDSEVAATCQSMGYRVEVCSVCGNEHTVVLDKLAHEFGEPVTHQATCTEYSYKSQTCTLCGEEKIYDKGTELAEHNYTVETELDATCSQPGQKIEKCTVCGDKKTTLIPVKGHTWDDGVLVPATCTEAAYRWMKCELCGADNKQSVGDALGHAYENGEVVGTVAATCTTAGYQVVKCERCDSTVMTNFTNALGHSYSAVEVVAATCTTEGYTIERCANCDNEVRTNPVAAKGHNMQVEDQRDATCTVDGFRNMVCADCGIKNTEIIKAQHIWDNEPTVESATCATPEYQYYVCTVCGAASEKQAFGEPLTENGEHTFELTVTKEANCYQTGLADRKCTVCGYADTIELPLTVHTYHIADAVASGNLADLEANYPTLYAKYTEMGADYYCTVTAASCTVSGSTIKRCDYCEVRYQDNTVAAIGHYFQEFAQEATCYSEGYTVMRCARENCNVELGERTKTADALLHKMTVTAEDGETKTLYFDGEKLYTDEALTEEFTATCNVFSTADGNKNVFYCDMCGAAKGAKLYVDRTFDMYDTNGNKLYNVKVEEVTETTVLSTEHNISDAYDTTDSVISCTEESSFIYYCDCCDPADRKFNVTDDYMVEEVKMIYHQVIEQSESEAACVTDATYTYTCERCGKEIAVGDKVNRADMQGKGLYIMDVYTGAEGYDPETDESEFVEITEEMFSSSKLGHNWDVTNGAEYVILDKKTFETYTLTERSCADTETLVLAIKCGRCETLMSTNADVAVGVIDENTVYVEGSELANVAHGAPVIDEANGKILWTNVTAYYYNNEGKIVTCQVGSEGYEEFLANAGEAEIEQIVLNSAEGEYACAAYTCEVCGENVAEQHIGNVLDSVVGCLVKQDCVFCEMNLKPYAHVRPQYTCVSQRNDGYYYCENCMKLAEEDTTYVPFAMGKVTAHSNVTLEVVTEATCTTDGVYKFTCACGSELEKDAKILVTAISDEEFKNKYLDGLTGEFALTEEMFTIPATGHTITVELVQDATCTEAGSYKLVCSVCDNDLEVGEYTLAELESVELDAIATAVAAAKEAGETKLTVTEEMLAIAALEHDYELSETIASTCTAVGYEVWVCKHDATHIEHRNETEALGHDFVLDEEHEGTYAATCDEPGQNHYSCSRCDATKTEEVAALGHDLVIEIGTAFNCLWGKEVTKFECKNGCGLVEKMFEDVETVNNTKYQAKVLARVATSLEGYDLTMLNADVYGAHTYSTFDKAEGEHGGFVAPTEEKKGSAYWTCSVCGSRDYLRESLTMEQYNDPNFNRELIKFTAKVNGEVVNVPTMYTFVEATETEEEYYKLSEEFVAAAMAKLNPYMLYTVAGNELSYTEVQEYLNNLQLKVESALVVVTIDKVIPAKPEVTFALNGEEISGEYTLVEATEEKGAYYMFSEEFIANFLAKLDKDAQYKVTADENENPDPVTYADFEEMLANMELEAGGVGNLVIETIVTEGEEVQP